MPSETSGADPGRHLIRYSGHAPFSPEVVVRAAGTSVFTESGRELLDFTSGQMSAILGHSHPASWPAGSPAPCPSRSTRRCS